MGRDAMYAWIVAVAGTAANLLFAAMFAARVLVPARSRLIGFAGTAMALPLAAASVLAVTSGLGIWAACLPLVFVAFAIVEVVVDDVLRPFEVRRSRWLWPYLLSFYLAQWAVVGAAFIGSRAAGFAVLASYFVCLAATGWSYRRVGHGTPAPLGSGKPTGR